MNVTDETPAEEIPAPIERASPGRLLKNAREGMRLTADDVARDLRLAPARVEALEADDYRNMPVPTFVRGYLRSYARLVRLAEDTVMAAYDEVQKPRVAPIAETPKPAPSVPRQARSGDRSVRAVTYLLVAILIALVFSWWKSRWELPTAPRPMTTREQENIPAPGATGEQATPGSEATAAAGTAGPDSGTVAAGSGAVSATAASGEPAAKTAAVVSSAPAVEALKKVVPVEAPKAVAETPKAGTAAKVGALPTSLPPTVAENTVQVSLIFDDASWADLRDARRQRLVYQQFKAGQSVTVAGVPPFKVYLSNAKAVRMRYAGEPYNVSAHQTGIYARFSVGTAVQ